MNETVDVKEKEINQQNPGAEITPVPTEVRKKRAWGMESQDNKVNKIGIKYHSTDTTSERPLNGHVTALDHWLISTIILMKWK